MVLWWRYNHLYLQVNSLLFLLIFECFWSFSTMRTHAQACVCWSKYTTDSTHFLSFHLDLLCVNFTFKWLVFLKNTNTSHDLNKKSDLEYAELWTWPDCWTQWYSILVMAWPTNYYRIQWGSEYQTSLVFEWSKVVRSWNSLLLEWWSKYVTM